MIEAFTAHTAEKTLTHGIGFRSANGHMEDLNITRCPSKLRAILAVIIAEQEARMCVERRSFAQLLRNPNIPWA